MNTDNFSEKSEQYKNELMKLYNKRSSNQEDVVEEMDDYALQKDPEDKTETKTNNDDIKTEDEEVFNVDEDAPDDTSYAEYAEEENKDSFNNGEEYNNRYPEPDLSLLSDGNISSDNDYDTPPSYASEDSLGSGRGYILVNVRAGDESTPIEGALVIVTAIVDGNRLILAEGVSNSSGTTKKFTVPAPDIKHSQAPESVNRPYNLYDISVTASGFFNARSVDVPVFDGITSVQNFSMIPVPFMMKNNDETLTYFNQEPSFNNIKEK